MLLTIVANFGRKLGEFNMLNYTEKIWGISCKKIHPDWAKQRIKGLNIRSALMDALFKKKDKDAPKTLVDQFYMYAKIISIIIVMMWSFYDHKKLTFGVLK